MTTAEMQIIRVTSESATFPTDDELDYFGITHEGKVRPDNQDHFLLATVHPQIVVHGTSLPDVNALPLRGSRFGTFALVADGVGGAASGSDAARLTTETIARYVSSTVRCYNEIGSADDSSLFKALKEAALQAHDAVRAEAASRPQQRRMATTLTMIFGLWPWIYVVQVGDSRCYLFGNDGTLKLVTRDQTIGQQLVDEGAMKREQLQNSPLKNVLASAIGADEATPEVTRIDVAKANALLLCSDGLTKHVSDDEIAERMAKRTSSEQVSRDLLNLALDRGGSDNITIVVAARRKVKH